MRDLTILWDRQQRRIEMEKGNWSLIFTQPLLLWRKIIKQMYNSRKVVSHIGDYYRILFSIIKFYIYCNSSSFILIHLLDLPPTHIRDEIDWEENWKIIRYIFYLRKINNGGVSGEFFSVSEMLLDFIEKKSSFSFAVQMQMEIEKMCNTERWR